MRGVILRETDILDKALKGEIDKKPLMSLRVLAKLYFLEGNSKEVVEEKLNIYMKKYYQGYKPSKWNGIINQLVKTVSRLDSYKMCDVNSISISETEWNKIIELRNNQLEKLAFILLIYCKINKVKNPNCDNKINNGLSDILTEAGLQRTEMNKLLLNELYKLGYISIGLSCNATAIQIKYIDNNKEKFVIDNFTNVISYYDEYKNEKMYTECEYCQKRIAMTKHNIKYCPKCFKYIKNEKNKSYFKKVRKAELKTQNLQT